MSGLTIVPDPIEEGEWVLRRDGRRVWKRTLPPRRAPQPARPKQSAVPNMIACRTCLAYPDERCRTRTGEACAEHAGRLIPRRCGCGELVTGRRTYCDQCRVEAVRASQREHKRRVRAERKVAS